MIGDKKGSRSRIVIEIADPRSGLAQIGFMGFAVPGTAF